MAADSHVRPGVRLTPGQALHERLMREVLKRVRGLDLVLKGGSALAFAYGLERHSTDLDFDAARRVELRGCLRRAVRAAGVEVLRAERDDWKKKQRFRAWYASPFEEEAPYLKVDVRFRPGPDRRAIAIVDGIRTYGVEAIFDQKVAAMRSRVQARDLFDLAFVMKAHGGRLGDDRIRWADAYLADWKQAKRRYAAAFRRDEVLRDLATVDETLARFRRAVATQRSLRWPEVQYQRVPAPLAVLGRVYAYRSRQRLESSKGTDPGRLLARTQRVRARSARSAHQPSTAEPEEDHKDHNRSLSR